MQCIVNKQLAVILKQNGFDIECDNWYIHYKLSNDVIFLQYKDEDSFTFAPFNEQAIDWIFSKVNDDIAYSKPTKGDIKWLKYWFEVLSNNQFTLIKEYIERLKSYFFQRNLIIQPNTDWVGFSFTILTPDKNIDVTSINDSLYFSWYNDGEYQAILECFKQLNK